MSVLIEAVSVVVKKRSLEERFPGGMARFLEIAPNQTCCDDGYLVRVGFMTPKDAHDFVGQLETCGLVYLEDGRPRDVVVVDQLDGPMIECDWVRLVRLERPPGFLVVACLNEDDSDPEQVATPDGWEFIGSLSDRRTFLLIDEPDEPSASDLVDFTDQATGETLYVGSSTIAARSHEFERIQAIALRAMELEATADRARQERDIETGGAVYEELLSDLLPRASEMTLTAQYHAAFSHFAQGLVLRILGRLDEAVEQFRKSLSHSPDATNTLLEITRCLGEAGNPIEAKGYAQHAVEVDHLSPQAWGNLAMTLAQLGDEPSARSAIDKALELAPEDLTNQQIEAAINRVFRANG